MSPQDEEELEPNPLLRLITLWIAIACAAGSVLVLAMFAFGVLP